MTHLFADYLVSFLIKQKGFDEPCFKGWFNYTFQNSLSILSSKSNIHGENYFFQNSIDFTKNINANAITNKNCAAPLWDQLITWLREVHQIDVNVFAALTHVESNPIQWCAWVVDIKKLISTSLTENTEFYSDDYNKVRKTAILHALTLI